MSEVYKLYELTGSTSGEETKLDFSDEQWLAIFKIMESLNIETLIDGEKTRYRATSEQSMTAMAKLLNTGIRVWSRPSSDETISRLDRQKSIFSV